jgi:2-aminobenzoate-CoA ligase
LYLPPRQLRPERTYTLPIFRSYPDRFNSTEVLLDQQVSAGRENHPALLFEDEAFTYGALTQQVGQLGNALRRLGVTEGDRVLIRSLNEPAALIANFAVLRLGGVVVPTSPLLGSEQLVHIANDCAAKVLVVSVHLLQAALAARSLVPSLQHVIVYGDDPAQGPGYDLLRYAELVDAEGPELAPVLRSHSAISVLLYTSGLLEPARATAHFQNELLIIPDAYGRYGWRVEPDDVIGGAGPISFAGGYSTVLTIPYRFGATAAVIPLTTTSAGMFPIIRKHRITLLAALPTRYGHMLRVDGADPDDLRTLRMVSGGGEPLSSDTLAGWRDRFGLDIYEGFGTNGMMHVFITTAVTRAIKPGSMGTPLPGYQTRLITPEGQEAASGEPGQLHVRGPVGTLYWGHPDAATEIAERQAKTVHNGWVHVGDWLTRDEEGDLYFVAREEDILRRGDTRFGPTEIERALEEYPAVMEAGVFASSTPDNGQRIIALVVLESGSPATSDCVGKILASARDRLGQHRSPDEIRIVDGLPRSLFGALLRRSQWPAWLTEHAPEALRTSQFATP